MPTPEIKIQFGKRNDETIRFQYKETGIKQGVFPSGTKTILRNELGIDVAEYQYVDAIVNTDPETGLVFRDYDENGRPQKAELVGEWETIPSHYFDKVFCDDPYSSGGYFGRDIRTFTLPDTVWTINAYSFYICSSLREIVFPDNIIMCYGSMCSGCVRLTSVVFKKDVTFFDNSQFSGCSALTSVVFGGEINAITNSAFRNDTSIMLYDFSHCSKVPPLYSVASLGHSDGCVLRIPTSLGTEWREGTNWASLQNVVWETV